MNDLLFNVLLAVIILAVSFLVTWVKKTTKLEKLELVISHAVTAAENLFKIGSITNKKEYVIEQIESFFHGKTGLTDAQVDMLIESIVAQLFPSTKKEEEADE